MILLILQHQHPTTGAPFASYHELPNREAVEPWLRRVHGDGWLGGEVRVKVLDIPEAWETINLPPAEDDVIIRVEDGVQVFVRPETA